MNQNMASVIKGLIAGSLLCFYFYEIQASSHVCTAQESYQERYTTSCGLFGWEQCTRHRIKYRTRSFCCTGWRSVGSDLACDHAICDNKIDPSACDNYFPNSHIKYSDGSIQRYINGTCSNPELCSCPKDGFYSAGPTCKMCSAITNCDLETCTSSSNQRCSRCEGVRDEKPGFRAYVISSDKTRCTKACSWRSDSTPCYPGSCANELASTCICTSGFTGSKCDKITEKTSIKENILSLTAANNGGTTDAPGNTNIGPVQDTVWTNMVNPVNIHFRFTADYQPAVPSRQEYVKDFKVGIISASLRLERDVNNIISHRCGGTQSRSNPNRGVFTCEQTLTDLSQLSLPFNHKDVLSFSMSVANGGFVKIENKETNLVETAYLQGLTQTNTFSITFDTVDPYHCKPQSGCSLDMLSDVDLSKQRTKRFSWDGWVDADAGIKEYEYELFELHRVGNELGVKARKSDSRTTSKWVVVTFPDPAVYSIILSAYDKAGNYKKARRLVIFDDTSAVTTTSGSVLRVTTALSTTNYKWQTNLNSVTISWTNRYINTVHHNGRFLAAVKSEPGVESQYDDNYGSRTTQPISNVQGIVSIKTIYKVDHTGGSSINQPSLNEFVDLRLDQQVTITPDLKDGDTLRYFIRAYDILSQYKEESLTVHFDNSPPVIENLWLTKGDEVNLAVHGFEELDKMVIEWIAYDDHSGIETVQWKILDHLTEVEHGSQRIPPQGETTNIRECQSKYSNNARGANCYCIPTSTCYHRHFQIKPPTTATPGEGILNNKNTGTHDHDYRIVVTVMNQAKLKTTLTKQITVDTSSPHQGMVHDGKYDTPEIDVQSDLELYAHWGGFFDRESGVKFYLYGFSTSCLGANKFQLNLANRQDIQQTTSTHASWTAPSDGKYYITVVAYNGALEVSLPVCSDGVVVDRTIGRPVIDPNKDTKTSISVSRGETGVLSIHVLAYPLPEFTWYYQLQDGSERPIIDVRCNQTDDGLSSTLTIQNVTVDDGRKYIVYVNNSLGTISIVFNMAVLLSSDDDVHGSNNTLLGIGIGVGLGIILFILLGIIFMRTGRRICFQKKTGNDQTVFDDARNQQTKSDNISLSEIPPIYEIVDTDAVNTRDPTDPDHIISETTPSPYEVLDIQATNLQHNIYQELNAPPESTYEGLDKQTTDQQSNIYEQLDLYENVTGTKMKGKDNAK